MAVVSGLENQPAQAGTTVPPKRIPSYMRPTKTSSQKTEDVKPKSKLLNPKDTNQAKRVVSVSVPKGMKSTLGIKIGLVVKGNGKETKDVKSTALLSLVEKVNSLIPRQDNTDLSRSPRKHHQ